MTIHVTPEPDFSYVSFETNIPSSSYRDIICKVLDTFNPGKFTVTIFTNQVRRKSGNFKKNVHHLHFNSNLKLALFEY